MGSPAGLGPAERGLDASIGLRLGSFDVDVEIRASAGDVIALLGPNGAGKTTVIRALAGLLRVARGRICLDGQVLDDPTNRIFVPAERRPVGVVFQEYLLFPHLSVLENVAFGLRSHRFSRADARRHARDWLERVDLAAFADRRPKALSGGQRQRVALARALAIAPHLLLLDEPLAALDASTRIEMRRELRRQLASLPGVAIVVTHEPLEAMALANHFLVMEGGRVRQMGTAEDLLGRPRSPWVAELVGVNLLSGQPQTNGLLLDSGHTLVVADPPTRNGRAFAAIHPRAVSLHRGPPETSARNVWQGTVRSVDTWGGHVRVRLDGAIPLVAEVTTASAQELGIVEGAKLWATLKATEVTVYPE